MDLQSEALQTALANTAPRTSENANSTFLLTETLDNLQFQGVLKDNSLTCVEGWLFNFEFAFAIISLINICLTFGDGPT